MFKIIILLLFLGFVKSDVDVKDYLLRYGYLSEKESVYTADDLKEGLLEFQKTFGLKESGIVDPPTRKLMNTPRCGVTDHHHAGAMNDNGWSKTNLTYYFYNYSPDLPPATLRALTARALKFWSDVTPLQFTRVMNGGDIVVSYARYQHRDDRGTCYWNFDGKGGVLAHAFFPPIGRIHFDDDEDFTANSPKGINYMWVATHELGHILGLQHDTLNRDAVMFPYYRPYDPKGMKLHPNDIRRIRDLYPRYIPATAPPTAVATAPPTTAVVTAPPHTKVVTEPPKVTTTPITTPGCSDELMNGQCTRFQKRCRGYSENWTDWMRRHCAKTCGYCSKGKGPCPKDCQDRNSDCPRFFKRCKGYSDAWTKYMRQNCRRTCRYCCLPA